MAPCLAEVHFLVKYMGKINLLDYSLHFTLCGFSILKEYEKQSYFLCEQI
jgi:hypothetical protein